MKAKQSVKLMGSVAALMMPFLVSCSDIIESNDIGSVLLEIELINYAWTPVHFGYVVEADGDVFRYDRQGALWEEQDVYSPDELDAKFSPNRQLVTTRPATEVNAVASRIADLPARNLSQPKSQCADAGALTYRAYKYNAPLARYIPVLLRVEGDWARQNTSAVAQELISYIRSLALHQEFPGCDP